MSESQKATARGFALQFDLSLQRAAEYLAGANWNYNDAFTALLADGIAGKRI